MSNVVDMGDYVSTGLIESVLHMIYTSDFSDPNFDTAFTHIVRKYIEPECPNLIPTQTVGDSSNTGAVIYLSILRLDHTTVYPGGHLWPDEPFQTPYTPQVGMVIHYGNHQTDAVGGLNLNQAALAVIMQLAHDMAVTDPDFTVGETQVN